VPAVYVYGESDDPADLSVLADDLGGGRLAAEHLLALGRRRIAHIAGPRGYRAARDRVAGLCAVLEDAGLPLTGGGPHYGDWSQRWGRHAAVMVLSAAPDVDAIFCGNDQIAVGVVETLLDHGRRVPNDVAVVGYDNWPPLTTVDLNLEQLGATAVEHLFAALDGRKSAGVIRQPCRLVVRDSTGPAPLRAAPLPDSPAPGALAQA
jgi:LacI family transcriptional regulator